MFKIKNAEYESEQYFTIAGYSKCTVMTITGIAEIVIKSGKGSMAYYCPDGKEHPKDNPWRTKGDWHPVTAFRKGAPRCYDNLSRDTKFADALNKVHPEVKIGD